jgi:hypothetical protein
VGRRKLGRVKEMKEEDFAVQLSRSRMDYIRTMFRHRVKSYPGRITLIVNEQQYKFDKNMGWTGVALGGLEVYSTPGDHWTRYSQEGGELAKRLLECLERAQAGDSVGSP